MPWFQFRNVLHPLKNHLHVYFCVCLVAVDDLRYRNCGSPHCRTILLQLIHMRLQAQHAHTYIPRTVDSLLHLCLIQSIIALFFLTTTANSFSTPLLLFPSYPISPGHLSPSPFIPVSSPLLLSSSIFSAHQLITQHVSQANQLSLSCLCKRQNLTKELVERWWTGICLIIVCMCPASYNTL